MEDKLKGLEAALPLVGDMADKCKNGKCTALKISVEN